MSQSHTALPITAYLLMSSVCVCVCVSLSVPVFVCVCPCVLCVLVCDSLDM